MNVGIVQIISRNKDRSGVNSPRDLLAADVSDQDLHAEIADLHGILNDEAVQFACLQSGDHSFGTVEANELDLPGVSRILQGA